MWLEVLRLLLRSGARRSGMVHRSTACFNRYRRKSELRKVLLCGPHLGRALYPEGHWHDSRGCRGTLRFVFCFLDPAFFERSGYETKSTHGLVSDEQDRN